MENRGIAFLTVRRCVLCLFVLYILILPTQSQAGILSCDDIVTKMNTELKLTQQQSDAVRPIVQQYVTARKQLILSFRQQLLTDKDAINSQMDQLKTVERHKLARVFSQDQMSKWLERENFNAMLNPDDVDDTGKQNGMGGRRHRHSNEDAGEDSSSGSGE
jgi:hypothetical protein